MDVTALLGHLRAGRERDVDAAGGEVGEARAEVGREALAIESVWMCFWTEEFAWSC
ncbi:hypothetical protein [Streptomyces sp. Ncost-T10-10d]|uniref:hypothetical protein n=1 Tax=Streptomyces sp. Ncost-T10-10d TaxID=1839774 RepID=UPI00159F11B4